MAALLCGEDGIIESGNDIIEQKHHHRSAASIAASVVEIL